MSSNILGLVAHNWLRHCDSKHNGEYDPKCYTCERHASIFADFRMDAPTILEVQRKLESRNV